MNPELVCYVATARIERPGMGRDFPGRIHVAGMTWEAAMIVANETFEALWTGAAISELTLSGDHPAIVHRGQDDEADTLST